MEKPKREMHEMTPKDFFMLHNMLLLFCIQKQFTPLSSGDNGTTYFPWESGSGLKRVTFYLNQLVIELADGNLLYAGIKI
jgi:hypothetical protein